jgi:hypothetical protein
MVKVVDGGAWRGSVLFALLGTAAIANACGGRTVWVEEGPDAGESGGVSGRGGDYGGGSAGDYGGGGYTGGYGGDYGGTYGGSYGGGPVTGGYGGTYGGGPVTGGYGGTYGGGPITGGVAGKGGYGGTGFGGSAGVTGTGGCGAASGSGGSSGSPALGKACSLFCSRFPYSTCSTDLDGPADCITQCRAGFGFSSWCEAPLTDFLMCAGQVLDPNALCDEQGEGACGGPGCFSDAVISCSFEYYALSDCAASPRPLPPCPPPPNPPLPPECGQAQSWENGYCSRETFCASGLTTMTECYYLFDSANQWACECYANGYAIGSLTANGTTGDACQQAAAFCGVY